MPGSLAESKGIERRTAIRVATGTIISEQSLTKSLENTMVKQIAIHGQQVKLYSPDGGRTWSSSPQSIVAYGRRKKMSRLELQKMFELIDERKDLDPNNFSEPKTL